MFWPFNKYPGSDYETFNYDWIIGKLKELKDSVAASKASEEAAAESANNASTAMGMALFYQNKARDYRDEAHGFADDAQASADSIAGVVNQVNTNTGRIDNLIAHAGDGTIPSELTDIRVGYNGHVYSTAGDAVRDQISDIHDELGIDLLKNAVWVSGKQITMNTGAISDSSVYSYVKMPVNSKFGYLKVTTYASVTASSIAFYDSNDDYIIDYFNTNSSNRLHTKYVKIPENAATFAISCFTNQIDTCSCTYDIVKTDSLLYDELQAIYNVNDNMAVFNETADVRLFSDGTTNSAAGFVCSNMIPVHPGQYLSFDTNSNTLMLVCYYDDTGTFIKSINTGKTAVFPDNAAYIRFGMQATTLKDLDIQIIDAEIRTIFDPIYVLAGTRINSNTGEFLNDIVSGYFTSYFIDVSKTPVFVLSMGEASTKTIYFYTATKAFINGVTVYPRPQKNIVNVPTNAKYMIISSADGFTTWNISPKHREVYIGAGRKYTSILNALKNEHGAVRFIIDKGDYNIVDEYTDEYGTSFWTDYAGYSGQSDDFLRGLTPEVGQELIFMPGANLVFDYDGNNTDVFTEFSVINLTTNNVIDGATITFGNRKARYAIHDDEAITQGTNIIRNCTFKGTSYNGPVIGGGCGEANTYYIEHCVFDDNNGSTDIMYHNSLNANAANRVHVRDCYGTKGVTFYWCGASTKISDFIVSNSKFPSIAAAQHPTAASNIQNIRLISYCNDMS